MLELLVGWTGEHRRDVLEQLEPAVERPAGNQVERTPRSRQPDVDRTCGHAALAVLRVRRTLVSVLARVGNSWATFRVGEPRRSG